MTRTVIVFCEHPFHSFNIIPQTLEKVTFNDIKIHQEKVSNTGEDTRKPFPKLNPKNWLYQSTPAKAQNKILLT